MIRTRLTGASLALLLPTSFTLPAYAECYSHKCENPIEELLVMADGEIRIKLDTTGNTYDMTILDCTLFSNTITIEGTATAREEWLAMLMTAQAKGDAITVRIANGSDPCRVNYLTQK